MKLDVNRSLAPMALAAAVLLLCAAANANEGASPVQLRRFIDRQVGGIEKLMVPANDADLPQPRLADGSPDPYFQTTEAKRYLGKQLFHDPARMVRIRPQFGGLRTPDAAPPGVAQARTQAGSLHYSLASALPARSSRFDTSINGHSKGNAVLVSTRMREKSGLAAILVT